jgi:carbon-monoxide dehydrogenase medium subunit
MKLRLAQPAHVVDLRKVEGLAYIEERDGGLAIGPMTTYYALESSKLVHERAPLLAEAAGQVADLQVRNKGSIGGAIAHADPAGDIPAAVLALETSMRTSGGGRFRNVPAHRFFLDIFTTALRETEVITEIVVPLLPPRTGTSYQKFANKSSHYAIVGVAAVVTLDSQGICQRVRIAVTGAGPRPTRARRAERYLTGKSPTEQNLRQAAQRAPTGIDFMSDLHGSAEYREHLTGVFTGRALEAAVSRAPA